MEPVYFIHISDTHIGPTAEYERHGRYSQPTTEQLLREINNLPHRPDFIIHTGDIVTDPDPVSYQRAAQLFAALDLPIYYVNGNHDRACDIRQYMHMPTCEWLSDDPDLLTYAFTVKGHRFVVVDGRAPDEIDPHGLVSAAQLEILRREVMRDDPSLTIFIHFPTWPLNSLWMDSRMLLINGPAFHQTLLPARDRLRGVFFGHIHQSIQTMRDGILYASAPSAFAQFTSWPRDLYVDIAPEPPGFNIVQLLPDQTLIRQYRFAQP
ncbi:MAG: metallophosphoesterase [Anaerolineales bacterium]|nr:metallophosphoesterase [Anaerolineales bacterium]